LSAVETTDPGAWQEVIDGMVEVTTAPYGGARVMAAGAAYSIAAKSGTAQVFTAAANKRVPKAHELVEHLRDHALFVAFAPADGPPKIAVAVVLENAPGGGAAFAGPIARRLLDSYLLASVRPEIDAVSSRNAEDADGVRAAAQHQ
jgi:penicillin-binding protein 2